MGNTHSQVFPELEHEAPWVMVTYNPGENYKNFTYHEKFDLYSNNSLKMNDKLENKQPCPPSCPVEYTINTNIINTVVEQVSFKDDMTVEELVETLFDKCSQDGGDLQDADKIKILFYWLTAQNVKYSEYKLTVDFLTVNYQLQKLTDGKNSYAAFFSLLCYYANIPCVIIRGHVKGGRYEVNKPLTSDLIREWNAVLINEEWQFVDTLWGRIYRDRRITREEWYLFPSPESLKYSHFPENKVWQLVEHPLSADEFTQLPILKKRFFEMNMELLSHTKGSVTCPSGDLEFKFQLNTKNMDTQEFRCVISRQTDEKQWEEEKLPDDGLRLQQLDFIQKTMSSEDGIEDEDSFNQEDDSGNAAPSQDIPLYRRQSVMTEDVSILTALSVKVRFQNTGYHKIEIVGRSREDDDYDWVAIYHVKVQYVPDRAVFFPVMPNIGYGPNPYLKKCGLKAVSHTNGEIKCFPPTYLEIRFKLLPDAKTKNVKLRYELVPTDDDSSDQLEKEDDFMPSKDGTITLPIAIKSVGEYKLSIAAMLNETDKEFVIHYRIVGEVNQFEKKEALALQILKELEMAIQSEKISELRIAISSAKSNKAQNHQKVKPKYVEAWTLVKQLQRYQEMLKRITEITNNHIAAIRSLNAPDPLIVKIMRVVFLLLGENENAIQNWDKMKVLITGIGQNNIRRRITGFNIKTLDPSVVRKAEKELKDVNLVDAMRIAEDVAAFAHWIDYILKVYKQNNDPKASLNLMYKN